MSSNPTPTDDIDKALDEIFDRIEYSYSGKTLRWARGKMDALIADRERLAEVRMFNRLYKSIENIENPIEGSQKLLHELNVLREELTINTPKAE